MTDRIAQIEADLAEARANWQEVIEISERMADKANRELEALEIFCGVTA